MGEMGGTLFNGPILHGVGHHGCHIGVQVLALLDGALQGLVGLLGEAGLHRGVVKYHGRKNFRYHTDFSFLKNEKATGIIWFFHM